jgi:hypothetical protein
MKKESHEPDGETSLPLFPRREERAGERRANFCTRIGTVNLVAASL